MATDPTTFYAAKHGQGTTTVAVAAALAACQAGPVHLVSAGPDAAAVLGMAQPDAYPIEARPGLTLHDERPQDIEPGALLIIDAGTQPETVEGVAYLVTRPCYLALRAAMHLRARPDGLVVITEPGRALSVDDVAEVIGAPVRAVIPQDPAVARAIDAGLLASRLPRTLARTLAHIIDSEAGPGPDVAHLVARP